MLLLPSPKSQYQLLYGFAPPLLSSVKVTLICVLSEQEEHTEKSKSATRGDASVSIITVSLVAVWLPPAPPAATGGGLTAGNVMKITATTIIKENILLFISILL